MPERFIVFAWARTGSYHLTSLLNSCDDVVCHGELFKPGQIELRPFFRSRVAIRTPEERDANVLEYIQQVRRWNPRRHFGFKIFPSYIDHAPGLKEVLLGDEWKIIALYRDPIETYASSLRAKKTGIWTVKKEREMPDVNKLNQTVNFTAGSLTWFSKRYNSFLNEIRILGESKPNKHFVIRYDQLGDAAVMDQLLEFIGSVSRFESLSSAHVRQFSKAIQEAFGNWGELSRYVQAHRPFVAGPEPSAGARQ